MHFGCWTSRVVLDRPRPGPQWFRENRLGDEPAHPASGAVVHCRRFHIPYRACVTALATLRDSPLGAIPQKPRRRRARGAACGIHVRLWVFCSSFGVQCPKRLFLHRFDGNFGGFSRCLLLASCGGFADPAGSADRLLVDRGTAGGMGVGGLHGAGGVGSI